MSGPLDELYLHWLYSQVASVRFKNPARTYWSLARHMYMKQFVWLVPNDDNRVEDGRDLRYEFFRENDIAPDEDWIGLDCSVLEMLIALSRRLAFEGGGKARDWFWTMLENLDLSRCSDVNYNLGDVEDILDVMIWRTYEPDGRGGLFPLNDPAEDQRDVEIRYQQASYILERGI